MPVFDFFTSRLWLFENWLCGSWVRNYGLPKKMSQNPQQITPKPCNRVCSLTVHIFEFWISNFYHFTTCNVSVPTLLLRWQQHRESQAMGTIFLFWLICSCWEIVSPSVLIYGLQEEVADWNLDSYQVLLTKLWTSSLHSDSFKNKKCVPLL